MKAQKEQSRRMLEGPLLPNVLLYTFPIILTSILQLLFNAADLVIVGRWCGCVSVAAVGATLSIAQLTYTLVGGLCTGDAAAGELLGITLESRIDIQAGPNGKNHKGHDQNDIGHVKTVVVKHSASLEIMRWVPWHHGVCR